MFIQRINYPLAAPHFDRFLAKLMKGFEEVDFEVVKLLLKSYSFAKHPLY